MHGTAPASDHRAVAERFHALRPLSIRSEVIAMIHVMGRLRSAWIAPARRPLLLLLPLVKF